MPADSVVAFQEKKYFGLSKRRLALVAVRLSYCVFQSLTLVEICSLSYEANKIYIIISISCREQESNFVNNHFLVVCAQRNLKVSSKFL